MTILLIPLTALILIAALIFGAEYMVNDRRVFRYDERNPYTRYCKICGQQQDQFGTAAQVNMWIDISPIPNPDCECHQRHH